MAEHKDKEKAAEEKAPEYVRVVANETPDKAGRLTQAGQIFPASRFGDVEAKIAANALAPVDAADVVPADADPTPELLETLRTRHRAEDAAWAKTQVPAEAPTAPAKTEE